MTHSLIIIIIHLMNHDHLDAIHTMHTRKDKKPAMITTKSLLTLLHVLLIFLSFFLSVLSAYLHHFHSKQTMRVTVNSPQHNHSLNLEPEPNCNNNNTNPTTRSGIGLHSPFIIPNLCYEPTSVLDLRHSPSPVADQNPPNISAVSEPNNHDPLDWDWDSFMREIGLPALPDDSVPNLRNNSNPSSDTTQIPNLPDYPQPQPFDPTNLVHSDFSLSDVYSSTQNFIHHHNNLNNCYDDGNFHQSGNWNVGFNFIEELLRAADCFDSDELQLAQVILDRLNQRLRSSPNGSKPVGKPLQRAAVYFKDALQSLLTGLNGAAPQAHQRSSWAEIVQTIRAYKEFSGISPIPMFSHFTTNQALLEALHGSTFIHVIDFDIGLGGQYASLLKELAEKADACRTSPPVIRITAVVPEEYDVEIRLIREKLSQFAQELKIRFQIDFLTVRRFEMLSFKAIKFMDVEKTAVLLSPYILRRLGSPNTVVSFLGDMRMVSPSVVVFVDGEGSAESGGPATSFRRNFVCGLEFFSIMLESLDAAAAGDMVRKIETFVLRPKIEAAVEAAGGRVPPWREAFQGAGMRPVELSQFADFQAHCLLGKVQVRGFHVAKRQAELVLCWHERALVSTSAWRC